MQTSSVSICDMVEYMTVHEQLGLEAIDIYDDRFVPRRELLPLLNSEETLYHGPRTRPRPHQLLEVDGKEVKVFMTAPMMARAIPLVQLSDSTVSIVIVGQKELLYSRPPGLQGWNIVR